MTPEEREGWLSAFPPGERKAIEEEINEATKALREENRALVEALREVREQNKFIGSYEKINEIVDAALAAVDKR